MTARVRGGGRSDELTTESFGSRVAVLRPRGGDESDKLAEVWFGSVVSECMAVGSRLMDRRKLFRVYFDVCQRRKIELNLVSTGLFKY